ncbi:MAG TPA: VacJ family lipoprotein [Rhizomicrobium sp.]|jgi:phospholipid-binding lipoprotein MlaA|nr:VacJ family lipoprotein [Rhizomicrobium sp.]
MRSECVLVIAICGLALASCATSSPEAIAANDPFEPMNRAVYQFDEQFNHYVVLSIAGLYLDKVPKPVRIGVHNMLSNAEEPVTIANDVLQLRMGLAARMTARLALNSTAGLGGVIDVAAKHGLPEQRADFGQTLSRYGVGEGPFLVLPVIGPEPPRQLLGDAADLFIDPVTWLPAGWPLPDRLGLTAGVHIWEPYVAHAANMLLRQELEKGSLDPYATMRSVYRQTRAAEINGGATAAPDK